jgi:hypothetical protein
MLLEIMDMLTAQIVGTPLPLDPSGLPADCQPVCETFFNEVTVGVFVPILSNSPILSLTHTCHLILLSPYRVTVLTYIPLGNTDSFATNLLLQLSLGAFARTRTANLSRIAWAALFASSSHQILI